jgi:rubredoxin
MIACTDPPDTMPDNILCASCGWTGTRSELETVGDERQCPVCADVVEFVD